MSGRAPGESRWRESATGTDAAVHDANDPTGGATTALLAGAFPSVTWSRIDVAPERAGRGSRLSEG